MNRFIRSRTLFSLCILISVFAASGIAYAQKITAEEIVEKHLSSIGPPVARGALVNQVATGLVEYKVLRAGGRGGNGKIVLASEANKLLFGMTFPMPTYPAETIIFDGKKVRVNFAYNNVRSYLGDFIYKNESMIKEGLMGGVLGINWPLLDLRSKKVKLAYDGEKKVNDINTYVLSYSPKSQTDLKIKLYFDQETYRHVRTEYSVLISSQVGSPTQGNQNILGSLPAPAPTRGASAADSSSQQKEVRQIFIEDFSDFSKEQGVTLPHTYRIYMMSDGASGTRELEFEGKFSQFFFNQTLDPASFAIDGKN